MDFKNANELLTLCEEKNLPISEIMRLREIELGETTAETVKERMSRVLVKWLEGGMVEITASYPAGIIGID